MTRSVFGPPGLQVEGDIVVDGGPTFAFSKVGDAATIPAYELQDSYIGSIDSITETDGVATVTITGGSHAGVHTVPAPALNCGDWQVLVRQATLGPDGSGVYSGANDGLRIRRTNPAPITERMTLRLDRTPQFPDDVVTMRVDGLTFDEQSYGSWAWDLARSGDFTVLGSTFVKNKAMGTSHGYMTAMSWDTAGTKNITMVGTYFDGTAIQTRTMTMEVVVPAVETVFPSATRRWIVDPTGNFTGAPTGIQVTTYAAAKSQAEALGGAARISLPSGQTLSNYDEIEGRDVDILLEDVWGGTAPVTIDVDTADINVARSPALAVVTDQITLGTYDPSTGIDALTGVDSQERRITFEDEGRVFAMVRCTGSKHESMIVGSGLVVGSFHMFDCAANDWEDYACFMTTCVNSSFRGLSFLQSLNAVNGDERKQLTIDQINMPDHVFRFAEIVSAFLGQIHVRSTAGWSLENDVDSPAGYAALTAHQGLRLVSKVSDHQSEVLGTDIMIEGGEFAIEASGGDLERDQNHKMIIANSYGLGTANSGGEIRIGHTGVRFVNVVLVIPNVLRESGNAIEQVTVPQGTGFIPGDGLFDDDIRFRNCTFLNMVSTANTRGTPPTFAQSINYAGLTDKGVTVDAANMVYHIPNVTLSGEAGPLDAGVSGELIGFPGTYLGRKSRRTDGAPFDHATDTFTQFATPAGSDLSGRLGPASAQSLSLLLSADMPGYDANGAIRGLTTSEGAYDQPTA